MRRLPVLVALAFAVPAQAVTIDWVAVGRLGLRLFVRPLVIAVSLVVALLPIPAVGRVAVATGDSLTNGYFQQIASDDTWFMVASGGTTAMRYVGLQPDPNAGNVAHDFAADTLSHAPDVIVFLLGTNDAVHPESWFANTYAPLISDVFSRFQASGAKVVLVTPIPIIETGYEDANQRLADLYNPWLRQQAADRGFFLLDLWSEIQALPDWELLYSDGFHLHAQNHAGFKWMADQVELAALAVLAGIPACSDGIDNDGDGKIDFDGGASANGGVALADADSAQCKKPSDKNEAPHCGLGAELTLLVPLMGLAASRRRPSR